MIDPPFTPASCEGTLYAPSRMDHSAMQIYA